MTMREWLKQRIKKAFENTESTITTVIVLGLLGGPPTILFVSKKALFYFLQIANTPTPLWATISLVLFGCLYAYRKSRIAIPSPSPSAKSRTKDVSFEDIIWTATKYADGTLRLNDVPRCKVHDLVLTNDHYHTYYCPETLNRNCDLKLSSDDLSRFKRIATSYIDKQFRDDQPTLAPPAVQKKSSWVWGWKK